MGRLINFERVDKRIKTEIGQRKQKQTSKTDKLKNKGNLILEKKLEMRRHNTYNPQEKKKHQKEPCHNNNEDNDDGDNTNNDIDYKTTNNNNIKKGTTLTTAQ